jgi:hypothetical protein
LFGLAVLALGACAEREPRQSAAPSPSDQAAGGELASGRLATGPVTTGPVTTGPVTSGSPAVAALAAGSQCGRAESEPVARWIQDAAGLARAQARMSRHVVGGAAEAPPEVDFTRERVLLIEMGQRPTAGYALALAEPAWVVEGAAARLRVSWIEPPPGAMVAQVLTSPCLLVRLTPPAAERLEVVDGGGRVRLALPL